jgi:[histone H3]-lysine9 N-trimethyltransferase SUV39H
MLSRDIQQQSPFLRVVSQSESHSSAPYKKGSQDQTPPPPAPNSESQRFPGSAFSVVIPPSPITKLINDRTCQTTISKSRKHIHPRTSSDEQTPSTEQSESPEPTGLSLKYYPVDALRERAQRGAYLAAREVNRENVKLVIPELVMHRPTPKDRESRPLSKRRYLQETIREKLSKIPGPSVGIAFEGIDSLTSLASNFEFVSSYVLRKGVEPVDVNFRSGCDCGPVCGTTSCFCLSLEKDSTDTIVPYHKLADGTSVLARDFLKRTAMIFECSSLCSCDQDCWNRVVERGRTVRLEIFHTGNRGFGKFSRSLQLVRIGLLITSYAGLRSPDIIRAGQFIDCYLGEVVTEKEADLREEASGSQLTPSYLFSLDFLRENDDDEIYVVDGQRLGSPMRFMNHSCRPNCKLFPVSRNHADNRLYELAFFSLREIPPMQELTFDYNPQMEPDREIDPNAVKCLCGESNCRGQLWPNDRKRTVS